MVINKAITLTSTNKSTIKGHLAIETENVTVKGLKFECNSTGYKYNEKNAISVFANKVTLTGNEFTQASGIGENYVTNGIVLYPQGQGKSKLRIPLPEIHSMELLKKPRQPLPRRSLFVRTSQIRASWAIK